MRSIQVSKISKNFMKVSKIFAISGSLLYSSTPVLAQGAANAILNSIGAIGSQFQQATTQQNQMMMDPKSIEAQQLLTRMQSEQANINSSLQSGSNRHYIFSNCLVPPDSTFKVENYCAVGVVPPESMAQAVTVAQNYIKMYESFMKPTNNAMGIGQQCITDSLNRMQADAEGLLKKYNEGVEIFKQNIKKAEDLQKENVEKMNEVSQLLYQGTQSNPDLADLNFSDMIGKDCSDAFKVTGSTLNQVGKSQGLMSISTTMDYIDESASDYRGPSLKIKQKRIEEDIRILSNEYKNGLTNIATTKAKNKVRPENWSMLENAMRSNLLDIKADTAEVNNLINELNSTLGEQASTSNTIPNIEDPNYQIKMNSMISKLDTQYKNKFVLSCIRGENSANRSDPVTAFLNNFRHSQTGDKGNITAAYKDGTIKSIISNVNSIEELESNLSSYYNSKITTNVSNQDGKAVFKSLKTLVNEQVEQCTRVYTGEDKTATTNDSLNNFRDILDKVKTKTNAIAQKTMGSSDNKINIQKELADKILNCDGRSISTQDCNDPKTLWSQESAGFCLKKANFCSQKVAQCGERIKVVKNKYTQELENRETQYNNQVKLLENQAEDMVKQMKAELTTLAGNLHDKIYPKQLSSAARAQIENSPYMSPDQKQYYLSGSGNDFNLPPLDPISLSEDKSVIQGASIKGGGDLRKELFGLTAGQMDKMKNSFKSYVQDKLRVAENIATDIKQNWENEIDTWSDIQTQCVGAIAQIEENEAKRAQDIAEANQEAQAGYTNFCNQLNGLAQQEKPNPGCGDDLGDLLDESMKVASVYVPDAYGLGQEMKSICMSANNDSAGQENSKAKDTDYIDRLCKKGGNWNSALSKAKKEMKNNIPSRLGKYKKKIENYIDGRTDDLPRDIEDDVFIHTARSLKELGETNISLPLTSEYLNANIAALIEKNQEVKDLKDNIKYAEQSLANCSGDTCARAQASLNSARINLRTKKADLTGEYTTSLNEYITQSTSTDTNDTNLCKVKDNINRKIFDSCLSDENFNQNKSTFTTCMGDSEKRDEVVKKFKDNNSQYQDINFTLKTVLSLEKSYAWSEMGEKYKYTSCAHITGNSIQKGMLENLGQDMANPFFVNGKTR